jgi:hypothetical protein
MKGGGKIEPPKATAALLSRLGWEDREIHAESARIVTAAASPCVRLLRARARQKLG